VTNCEIWHKIGSKFLDSQGHYNSNWMYEYQTHIEKQRAIWKQVLGIYRHHENLQYQLYMYNIFKNLQELSLCTTVIDSSKSVGRALALLKNNKLDVKVIHLVRDPRGLYYSFQKKDVITPVKNIFSVATYWNTTNILADLIKIHYRKNKVIRIRYEDLVTKPYKTIDQIGQFLNENLADVKEKIENDEPLERAHIVSGNRLRTQKSALKLKPDLEWKKKLKFHQRNFLSIACFPLMLTYGYFKNDSSNSSISDKN
jgi:hypothetical protein